MDTLRSDTGPDETGSAPVDAVVERVRERLPAEDAARCESFVRQYFRWVPPTRLVVERVPAGQEKGTAAAYYQQAAMDGSRPSRAFHSSVRPRAGFHK